jgi:hypothetical protein
MAMTAAGIGLDMLALQVTVEVLTKMAGRGPRRALSQCDCTKWPLRPSGRS